MPDGAVGQRTLLAFDYGLKNIGVAVGQEVSESATPLTMLRSEQGDDWRGIGQIIDQWQPHLLLVGLPLTEDGESQSMTEKSKRFGRRLHGRFGLPVFWIEEAFTSSSARSLRSDMSHRQRQKKKHSTDALAASMILQSWFQSDPSQFDAIP